MKLFKNKKGSILVEKILMVAFAAAAGGAVIIYGANVINNSKNTEITGILNGGGQEELNSHFDDTTKTINITLEELNTKSFSNTGNFARNLSTSDGVWGSTIIANGYTFSFDEVAGGEYMRWWHSSGLTFSIGDGAPEKNISLIRWLGSPTYTYEEVDFTTGFTFHTDSQEFYNDFKQVLISDL